VSRLVLAAACAALVACSGAQPKAAAPPSAAMQPVERPGDVHAQAHADAHAEIDALDRQIADELARAHVPPPAAPPCTGAGCAAAMSQSFSVQAPSDATCHPAASDRCTDACSLSTSICNNQQKICDLAQQLAGDDWAANKCTSARASCQAARASCCSCVL
jgi:hypothetical protein